MIKSRLTRLILLLLALSSAAPLLRAEIDKDVADPAQEASVKAVAKAMPAVVNINTESIVKRTVRDPMDAFYNDFFGRAMRPPRLRTATRRLLPTRSFASTRTARCAW